MIVASFLTKHLLIDWRWGEAYFAEKLLDYELSSNNGLIGNGRQVADAMRLLTLEFLILRCKQNVSTRNYCI